MKELIKKYENEILSLIGRRMQCGFMGKNQKTRIDTEIEVLEKVVRDLRNAI